MATKGERQILHVAGREVAISNPQKVLFPAAGHTKLDLVEYYLSISEGALRGAGGRPNVLVRYLTVQTVHARRIPSRARTAS